MQNFNVYCDESRHLVADGHKIMVLGAVYLPASRVRAVSDDVRELKVRHGLSPSFEVKWTKVSPAQVDFYEDLVDLYLKNDDILFRAVVAGKHGLDHNRFNQTHDDWYYKIYYQLLQRVILRPDGYRIFLDIKDASSATKIRLLHEVLANAKHDDSLIQGMQTIRSHESSLMQLADLLIGAVSQANSNDAESKAKRKLIKKLCDGTGESLTTSSKMRNRKMNVFCWTPAQVGGRD